MNNELNFKSSSVFLIDSLNGMERAWRVSKPTYGYEDGEVGLKKLKIDLDGLMSNDLPICGFNHYSFEVKAPLIVRDMILSFRPIMPWASSNRIEKRTFENSYLDEFMQNSKYLKNNYEDLKWVITEEDKGVALDVAKRRLPLSLITGFNFTFDYRSLMCMLKTFEDIDCKYFKPLILQFLRAIVDSILRYKSDKVKDSYRLFSESEKDTYLWEYFQNHPAKSILSRIQIPEKYIKDHGEYLKKNTSRVVKSDIGFELGVYVANSLGAQFIRQHYSKIRNGYFNLAKEKGMEYLLGLNCSHETYYISEGQIEALDQLISRRTCWVAQFDWEDKYGWSGIIGGLVRPMTPQQFKEVLPCQGSCNKCTIKDETKLRLHTKTRRGSTDDHVPDENPLCPILVENREWMKERVEFYGSDLKAPIVEKWIDLSSMIIKNPKNKGTLVYEGIIDVDEYTTDEETRYRPRIDDYWISRNFKKGNKDEDVLDFINSLLT